MSSIRTLAWIVLACAILGASSRPARTAASEFRSLFDGHSFMGWEGNQQVFRIKNGAIVAGSLERPVTRNEFLCTRERFGDFELRLKFKVLGGDVNAGVQIRSERIPNHHEVKGYQADLGQQFWGCLYDESRRARVLAQADQAAVLRAVRPRDWNEYIIRCEGARIQLWINGLKTVDYTERDSSIPRTGVIGLQIHGGPPSEAWYKEIRIKAL